MSDDAETPATEDASILGGAQGEADAPEQGGEEAQKPADAEAGDAGDGVKAEGDDKPAEGDQGEGELAFDVSELQAPDGFEMDEETLKAAEPLFKELGLDKDGAQRLVEFYAERVAAQGESAAAALAETTNGWMETIKSEWGDKFDENVSVAAKAVDLGGDELREALNVTGAGNHPAVIKFFHQIGQQLSEDGFQGSKPQASDADWMDGLYPSMQTPSGGS